MTDKLDPNELGRLLRELDEFVSPPRHGRVVNVWTHDSETDQSNHEVDVAVPPGGEVDQQHRRIPVKQPISGAAFVPQEDDLVLVVYRNSDEPVALGAVYGDADADRAPLATEGDIRIRRGDLYTELAGDGSHARIARKPGDLEAPTAEVAIDDQGNVTIQTDGNITVSAGGDVVIDEGGEAKSVATEDHTHDYSWTDAGGSGTTGPPSETTSTEIE